MGDFFLFLLWGLMSRFGPNFICIAFGCTYCVPSVDLHNLVWLTEHSSIFFCLAWDRRWMSTYLSMCSFVPTRWLCRVLV